MRKLFFILVFCLFSNSLFAATYNYSKSGVNLDRLKYEIENSDITIAIDSLNYVGTDLTINMKSELSSEEENILNSIVSSHTGEPMPNENNMEILLGEGKNKRLKFKGYSFTAYANSVSTYNFAMPFDANLQGGKFLGTSAEGDEVSFILMPDTPYEFWYVEKVSFPEGTFLLDLMEDFSMSQLLPEGTLLRVIYKNNGGIDKNIHFIMVYRL